MGAYTRFAAGAAAFGLSLAAWAAPVYHITDLGVLPSHEHSRATDLNEGGQVVGDSQRYAGTGGPGERRAFVWSAAAGMIDLGLPDGASTMNATGLNDTGEVVGHYEDPASRLSRAYRWTAQGGLRLADPADGAVSLLYDINAADLVDPADPLKGVARLDDAAAVNASGQIVGQALIRGQLRAVLLTPVR